MIHGNRSFQVGQFHHATEASAPVAKIDWHPWGQGGSTLLVLTTDGKLRSVSHTSFTKVSIPKTIYREYDISEDADEPQQTLSFVSEKKKGSSFLADDGGEREAISFSLGKGRADWGPLTVYAVMRSGDIYAMSPYMPKNA